jgi:agmatinase
MTREEAIKKFDPNGPGIKGNLFGLPFTPENAALVIIPVPWEVTVSYHTGTGKGPQAIIDASYQIDLALKDIPEAWKLGVSILPVSQRLYEESENLRELAFQHIQTIESQQKSDRESPLTEKINEACENLNIYIKTMTRKLLYEGKLVALLGGDHSTPLGFIRTLSEHYNHIGILQFDAHADLRKSYEGFAYSHASIMYNILKIPSITKLVQVGIRDYCDEELQLIQRASGRIVTYFDQDIKEQLYDGKSWGIICEDIIKNLPQHVYISFDIDGLNPTLCPNTGTPVAGGLEFAQAIYLIGKVVNSGRKIIGFDLTEVAPGPNDWDANVGARLLYQLCTWMGVSQGKLIAKA